MPHSLTKYEYWRRRLMPLSELVKEADWWDFPFAYKGLAHVEIGGERIWIDMTKAAFPCVITRPYFPC